MDAAGGQSGLNNLKCIATTREEIFADTTDVFKENSERLVLGSNYFKSASWTPDGTSIITTSADNGIQTFIIPADLLDETSQPHHLTPYSTILSTEPVNAFSIYPGFDLSENSTTLILSSARDHPIRLNSALSAIKVASYPLINPTTEAFISPNSLTFIQNGTHFVTGSENLISVFDTSRVGSGPISYLPTGSKRGAGAASEPMSMKGIVSALAIEPASEILVAGTFTRNVGLYSSNGQGECVGVFCVEGTDADLAIGGGGITQVSWSPCGRYLYIAERKSDGVILYDIRKTGQLLGWLEERNARTNQRLGVDIASFGENENSGHDIWAGSVDGVIRKWEKPHECEGAVQPHVEWVGHGGKCYEGNKF